MFKQNKLIGRFQFWISRLWMIFDHLKIISLEAPMLSRNPFGTQKWVSERIILLPKDIFFTDNFLGTLREYIFANYISNIQTFQENFFCGWECFNDSEPHSFVKIVFLSTLRWFEAKNINILVSEILNNFFSTKNINIVPELILADQVILNISTKDFFYFFSQNPRHRQKLIHLRCIGFSIFQ